MQPKFWCSSKPKYNRKLRQTKELVYEITKERLVGVGRYATSLVTDEDRITDNRRYATARFAELNKIDSSLIDPATGLLKVDRFHENNQVQYVNTYMSQELVSVAKMAWASDMPLTELRTPFNDIRRLNPELHERLTSLPDGSVAELGSLAKKPGISQVAVLSTLREIYKTAEENGVEYMMAGLEPQAWPRYRNLFGHGIELVSEEMLQYPGIKGGQVGICMNITNAYELYKQDIKYGALTLRAERLLVNEFYANRIGSFVPRFKLL